MSSVTSRIVEDSKSLAIVDIARKSIDVYSKTIDTLNKAKKASVSSRKPKVHSMLTSQSVSFKK